MKKEDSPKSAAALVKNMSEKGLRMTAQRKQLATAIEKVKHPFTAEELFKNLQKTSTKLDLVTVYRSLHLLESLEILQKSDFGEGAARYCIAKSGDGHHHHHVMCRKCNKISPVNLCLVEAQEKLIEKMGYTQISHKLEFVGLCPDCSED